MEDKNSNLDILAFGAHPDDVEFACGGLLLKAKKLKLKTGIVDLTLGELGDNGTVEERLKEAKEAANFLGCAFRENLNLGDNKVKDTDENRKKVVEVIRKHRPKMVLAPYWSDRHPDHEATGILVKKAVFSAGVTKYQTNQPAFRPKYLFFYMLWEEFKPSVVLDITSEWEDKVKALLIHKSQFKLEPGRIKTIDNQERTLKFWEARARNYGFWIGKDFGEPYLSIWPLGTEDLFNFLPNLF